MMPETSKKEKKPKSGVKKVRPAWTAALRKKKFAKGNKRPRNTHRGKDAKRKVNPPKPHVPKAEKTVQEKKPKVGKPKNYELVTGIMRHGRVQMYKKKALWRHTKVRHEALKIRAKKGGIIAKMPKGLPKVTRMVKKTVGGEKNGESRMVRIKKLPNYYPTQEIPQRRPRVTKQGKPAKLRPSLTPGTVCIVLAGKHKGKRVVYLKQLRSGLLLVTGPFWLNRFPLRRMNQCYVIGTSTKINLGPNFKVPDHVDDEYFKRMKLKAPKKEEGEIFQTKKLKYSVSLQRKKDQNRVDRQVMRGIHGDTKGSLFMIKYLCAKFGLSRHQYPHRMKF